jgi:hypothetical protein
MKHVESAPADLDWLSVGKELAPVRRNLETTEAYARRRIGAGIHRCAIIAHGTEVFRSFQGWLRP